MDLHQLQAFDQIAQLGNFSKAARKLGISQPTISLRIQALEQAIGGPLFMRGGSHLELTEFGRSFLPYAQQALRAMTTGVEIAQETVKGKRGRVAIGTLPSLATGFFASALKRLHHTHPHLDIVVHTGHNQQIIEMLYDNYVHVGFLTAPFFHPDLTTLFHLSEPLLIVAHAQHPLTQYKQVFTADLEMQAKPFFHIDWSIEVRYWQSHVKASSEALIEVPPQTARDLLIQGIGVALLTRSFIDDDLKSGRLVEIMVQDMPALTRESILTRLRRDEPLPPAVLEFIRIFQEEARACIT